MSRQKGRRSAPRPARQAYVESLHQRSRRVRPPRPDRGASITTARRWGAVGTGTVLLLLAFAGVVTAIVERDNGNTADARSAAIIALLVAPLSLVFLGVISRARSPVRTAFLAAPAAMAGFFVLAGLLRDPATAVVAAFGVGGAFVLRVDEGVHSVPRRLSVVGILTVMTLVAYQVLPDATIVVAPLLPFVGCALADLTVRTASVAGPD